MKQLIIYAHPSVDNSMNNRIKDRMIRVYKKFGHDVILRDLYDIKFNPVLSPEDLKTRNTPYVPLDVKQEQQYISDADVINVVYPVWWTGMPAILKGYFDRVFQFGFAYGMDQNGIVKLLKGKKAFLVSTHGMPQKAYENGMYKALNLTSDSGIFDFCGIEVLHHEYFASASSADDATRMQFLESLEQIIAEKVISTQHVEHN